MNLVTLEKLLSLEGRAALAAGTALQPTDTRYPACVDRLRKRFPDDLARAALDTVMLRQRAAAKYARAEEMVFTREGLEMASGEVVANHRAKRFAGFGTVADLCCGIGADSIGLALAGASVVSVDRDSLLLRMTEANLAVHGRTARFLLADVLRDPLPECDAAFADPGRRPAGKRVLSLQHYEPPVAELLARWPVGFPIGVKVAPGVPRIELPSDVEAEFVSLNGELKECVLWYGPLRSATLRATVLPSGHTLAIDGAPPMGNLQPIGSYLYDPDPSISRSGLTGRLANELDAWVIDPEFAVLSSDELRPNAFATAYRVEAVLPYHVKRVGVWLREHSIGRVTIVKLGSRADADELLPRWRNDGSEHRQVILTRDEGNAVAVIAERV